jgi:hypothetical protein
LGNWDILNWKNNSSTLIDPFTLRLTANHLNQQGYSIIDEIKGHMSHNSIIWKQKRGDWDQNQKDIKRERRRGVGGRERERESG